jgi:anti-sigma regulatory factor (Ser/Thr protein kinase)
MSERAFGNSPRAVSEARHFVVDDLAGLPQDIVDEVAVIVSELVTNCVLHTDTDFVVRVEHDSQRVRVEVTDYGDGTPTPRVPPISEPSGRGLRIVRELADDFGVRPLPDPPGKTVWFSVDLEPRTAGRGPAERNVPQR